MGIKQAGKKDVRVWAEKHFGDIDLGDVRRDQRAVEIAAAMAASPNKSIPEIFERPYDVKAAYNFLKHEEATPGNLQAGHRELVVEELRNPGRYLLLEDTTGLSWNTRGPIKGMGPIGPQSGETQKGFLLHSVLAARWQKPRETEAAERSKAGKSAKRVKEWDGRRAVEIIGLADQQSHVRRARPVGEKASDSKATKKRERESQLWERAGVAIGEAPAATDTEWIRVCDRGADIYEMLTGCVELNHKFVIRASSDRLLTNEKGKEKSGKLFEQARAQEALGEFRLKLRARPGQSARTAQMKVSAVPVWLRSPHRPGKAGGGLAPVQCTVVRVWEENVPKGVTGLEWILLTDLQVSGYDDAMEVALIYSARWIIEEFHKALKSGTRAEDLQLARAEALFAAIAIKSVVALRLIDLRERVRDKVDKPANESGLTKIELEVLRVRLKRPIKTVKDVALAIGRLGGHMNRTGDGMPGWQTLFRGMERLNDLVEGVQLALKMKRFG